MTAPDDQSGRWLVAEYTFATVFSYRMPMSSIAAAQGLPTPGPATVRLALIRSGLEMVGERETQASLFPIIRAMAVRIQPPERVAVTQQTVRGYKATRQREHVQIREAPLQRGIAHAQGALRIGINVPPTYEQMFRAVLAGIGYWGQAFGLAWCQRMVHEVPDPTHCVTPLSLVSHTRPVQALYTGLATEFRQEVAWDAVMPGGGTEERSVLQPGVYVWPLRVIERRSSGMLLKRCSI